MQFYLTMFQDRNVPKYDTLYFRTDGSDRVILELYDDYVVLRFEGDEEILTMQPVGDGVIINLHSNNPAGSEQALYYRDYDDVGLYLPYMDGIAQKFLSWFTGADRNGEGLLRQYKVIEDRVYLRPQH